MIVANRPFKVKSGRVGEVEAGYEPHLEGVFSTEAEATAYIACWTNVYANQDVIFWMEK